MTLRPARLLTATCALAATLALPAQAQVGLSRLALDNIPVTLVYPSPQAGTPQAMGPITLTVALDAAPTPGAHRLVVMSHGTGGSPLSDHAMAAAFARAGFVVAQPQHAGDNFQDSSKAGPEAWVTRPQEVSRVIDALAAHPTWKPLLKLDRVGVHGMSAGGATALALAGARWRTLDLVRHCLDHADDDLGFCFNGLADPAAQAQRKAGYERARGVPELFLPASVTQVHGGRQGDDPRPDPRIAAATVAVPVAAIFSADSLAGIRIPVGVVGAQRDTMLLPRYHSQHALANCRSCTLLDDLKGAGHFDLLAPWPEALALRQAALHPRGGAPEPGFDTRLRDAAFDRIAAFHKQQLGD